MQLLLRLPLHVVNLLLELLHSMSLLLVDLVQANDLGYFVSFYLNDILVFLLLLLLHDPQLLCLLVNVFLVLSVLAALRGIKELEPVEQLRVES